MTTTTKKLKKYHIFIFELTEEESKKYNRRYKRPRYILKIGDSGYRQLKRMAREYYVYRTKLAEDLLQGDGEYWYDAQFVWDVVHFGTKLE